MELDVKEVRTIKITDAEFRQACQHVRMNHVIILNSFLGTFEDVGIEGFIRELSFYLFTGDDNANNR